jgi:hypothetical protein
MTSAATATTAIVKSAKALLSTSGAAEATKGNTASSGTMARSWKSRIAKDFRPWRRLISPRSSSTCKAKAVEDRARPKPITTDAPKSKPGIAIASAVRAMPVRTTCKRPRPNISRRSSQSRDGLISSPMTNSRKTTPSSATLRISSLSVIIRPIGPMTRPAAR